VTGPAIGAGEERAAAIWVSFGSTVSHSSLAVGNIAIERIGRLSHTAQKAGHIVCCNAIPKMLRHPDCHLIVLLRDARIKRGLSVAEVAEQVGVSRASIYFWENDRVRPRDANLTALCKVLKLPVRATKAMAIG
jgi:DNA-binding XRE family transcriptional regulator